jgi:hypothetical protein
MEVTREEFDALKKAFVELMKSKESGKEDEKVSEKDKEKVEKKEKKKRAPSEYNIFLQSEIKKIKEKNPDMSNTGIFKVAVENYKKHKAQKE